MHWGNSPHRAPHPRENLDFPILTKIRRFRFDTPFLCSKMKDEVTARFYCFIFIHRIQPRFQLAGGVMTSQEKTKKFVFGPTDFFKTKKIFQNQPGCTNCMSWHYFNC